MFLNFKKIPVFLNSQYFVCNNAQISNEVTLVPKYNYDSPTTTSESPSQMWVGSLKLQYYLTGYDYLKQYIYSQNSESITGNIGGLIFNQGYLSNYSINIEPNSPILVNAEVSFYDQLSGVLSQTLANVKTGLVFRSSDVQINNISGYTANLLNNFTRASFNYNCNLQPTYNYTDTGIVSTSANQVFLQQRTLTSEISSDSINTNLPLSGEDFGSIFTFSNPSNTGLFETIGCSGKISSKSINVNSDSPHIHTIKIIQHHVNDLGYIASVSIFPSFPTPIVVRSNIGGHPFTSNDASLSYVDSVFVGSTQVTGNISVARSINSDVIVMTSPFNTINDVLTINTNYRTFVWPNKLVFNYPAITITGISCNTGNFGNVITISGTNFINITDVLFGGNVRGNFQATDYQTISATVPNNGSTAPIIVYSQSRNISGQSASPFFYPPYISLVTPLTGYWKDTLSITGSNFSGITGAFFNNVQANSINVINNNLIQVQTPDTGKGYASGNIYLYGTGGQTYSIPAYNPEIPIYSFIPTSGLPNQKIIINTKIDTGYLYSTMSSGFLSFTAGAPSGLSLWYRLDGDGSDSSVNNVSANLIGNPTFVPDISGYPNSALALNGTSQYVFPTVDPFNTFQSWTISVWWSGWTQGGVSNAKKTLLASRISQYGLGVELGVSGATLTSSIDAISSLIINQTGWNNSTAVFNNTNGLSFYLNGVSGAFIGLNSNVSLGTFSPGLKFGFSDSSSLYYNGNLDDIRVYNYALSSGDVRNVYNKTPHITPQVYFTNSGGYKVKVGGQDVTFFISGGNSTGALTGSFPTGAITDYVSIYKPDGISSSTSTGQILAIGVPIILGVNPTSVPRYSRDVLNIYGGFLSSFNNSSCNIILSGGISGDTQLFSTGTFINSLDGTKVIFNGIIFTGNTGYYNIIATNSFGSNSIANSVSPLLTMTNPVNLAPYYANDTPLFGTNLNYSTNGKVFSFEITTGFNQNKMIDNNASSYALISNSPNSNANNYSYYVSLSSLSSNPISFGTISINADTSVINTGNLIKGNRFVIGQPQTFPVSYSGAIIIFSGASVVVYSGGMTNLNGFIKSFTPYGLSGISEIRICSFSPVANTVLPITEFALY